MWLKCQPVSSVRRLDKSTVTKEFILQAQRLLSMKKAAPFLLLLVLALLVLALRRCQNVRDDHTRSRSERREPARNRNRGFDRTLSFIEYTEHARCRMKCRQISQEDVEDIMRSGQVNYRKSDLNDRPCPVYAIQGYTRTNEHLRIIFGQCDKKTKVITCYNLDQDFECQCPGDEKSTNEDSIVG